MQSLINEIRHLTQVLAGLRADNLVIDNLDNILTTLKSSDINQKVAGYKIVMPTVKEDEQAVEKDKEVMKEQADSLNKEADYFLDELERIKTMRHTLNLEALDPIIQEARRVIHSIHGLTAGLED
jgi:hypothetical protein